MQHNKKQNQITIETTFDISLEQLSKYLLKKRDDITSIFNLLDNTPEMANRKMGKVLKEIIGKTPGVQIEKIEFEKEGSYDLSLSMVGFKTTLTGTKEKLKKVVGDDKLFQFDWNDYQQSKLKC